MNNNNITGIHHITALAGNAQRNLDFYTHVLGLRFIKRTVNFDDPGVYHLYYGDHAALPGSVFTFFPYNGIRQGRHGYGMVNTTAFSVPMESIAFWESRLESFRIPFKNVQERFGREAFMYFEDPDGLGLELVFTANDPRPAHGGDKIPEEYAIRGFHHAEIWAGSPELTASLLTNEMDHLLLASEGNRFRYAANDLPGHYIDLLAPTGAQRGLSGAGTIHHIAFATPDDASHERIRRKIASRMLNPTAVIDRKYFRSVYFREPGGVLFEIATNGPGFDVDEPSESLGQKLMLPMRYEAFRDSIEQELGPLSMEPLTLNANS